MLAGNRANAFYVYHRLRKLLDDELGAGPSPETEAIFRAAATPSPDTYPWRWMPRVVPSRPMRIGLVAGVAPGSGRGQGPAEAPVARGFAGRRGGLPEG